MHCFVALEFLFLFMLFMWRPENTKIADTGQHVILVKI